jgi:P-type Ca2+ transporter type 2C
MFDAFKDTTILILSVAAVVSLSIGLALAEKRAHFGYIEGLAIVAVVLVVVFVQAGIDYQKEIRFRQLNSVKDSYPVQAIRAGHVVSLLAGDVLVGDVLKVTAGDKVAADAILLDASCLKTNESAMTGEVVDVSKTVDGDPFLLSGTTVSEGVGHILVIAVGERSQWGVILSSLIVEPEDTPLQERLNRLAIQIGKLGLLFAAIVFFVSLIRWGVRSAKRGGVEDGTDVLRFFIDVRSV